MKPARLVAVSLAAAGAVALVFVGLVSLGRLFARHPAAAAEAAAGALVAGALAAALLARLARRLPPVLLLELDLTTVPPEDGGARSLPARLSRRRPATLAETVEALERAAGDGRVRGIVVRPRFGAAPRAAVEELRDALVALRHAGKAVVAVADSFGEGGPAASAYHLATASDRIVLHPTGLLGLVPPSLEHDYYRGLLDRAGVDVEVLARHEYKSALSRVSERSLTAADREQSQRLLDSVWDRTVADVAAARGIADAEVRRLADDAPVLAHEALAAGLVDRVAYDDEAVAAAKAEAGSGARLLDLAVYRRRAGRRPRRPPRIPVAVLRAVGEIHRTSRAPFGVTGGPVLGADRFALQIRAAARDRKVKAVVLRIDSPGGSAVASDSIWRELVRLRQAGKPLVASMGGVAASGGYYLAAAADRIVAQPGSVTGSIGVIAAHPVVSAAKAKLGVTVDGVHAGSEPPALSPNRPLSPRARARFDAQLDHVYEVFVARVAEGRHLSPERVGEVARGRVWTGADAREVGLVDELGGLGRAVALAVELSGAPAGTRGRAVSFPRRAGPLGSLRRARPESTDDVERAAQATSAGGLAAAVDALAGPPGGPVVALHLGCDPRRYWFR